MKFAVASVLLFLASSLLAAPSFEPDVWPILRENCYGCHSQAEKKAKGGLSLDTKAEMLKGGEDGPFFVPGKPDDSQLVKMVSGAKPEMPKKQSPLSVEQVKILHDWVASGGKIDAWPSMNDRKVVIPQTYRFAPAISSIAFSPDGSSIAAACRSEVILLPVKEQSENSSFKRLPTTGELITHVTFSKDGSLLATAGGSPARFGEVNFFETETGKLKSSRRLTHDTVFGASFSPDGKQLVVGGSDGALHFVPVDPKSPERATELLHSDWVMSVVYSPDGKLVVSGGRDKAIKVCAAESARLLVTFDMSSDIVTAVTSDSYFAIAANRKGDVTSFEYKIALSGIEVAGSGNGATPIDKRGQYTKAIGSQGGELMDMAISGDRKLIAVPAAGQQVRLYNIVDRKMVVTITKVVGDVFSLALNSDGSQLAVGTKQGLIHLYQLPAGKLIRSITPVPVVQTEKSLGSASRAN